MLYQTTCSTQITVGPKSVLTLYCVPKVLVLTSVVTLVSRGKDWSQVVLYFEVSLVTLDVKYWGGGGGGLCPPNLNIGGAGAPQSPPAPTPLAYFPSLSCTVYCLLYNSLRIFVLKEYCAVVSLSLAMNTIILYIVSPT